MRLSRCVGCRPCGRSGGATRLVWRAAVGAERPVASLPRSEHEHRAGRFITRWRPEGSEEWLPPEGMLPKPVSQEAWIGGIELDDYVRFLP